MAAQSGVVAIWLKPMGFRVAYFQDLSSAYGAASLTHDVSLDNQKAFTCSFFAAADVSLDSKIEQVTTHFVSDVTERQQLQLPPGGYVWRC
jgi:hypothetical protein